MICIKTTENMFGPVDFGAGLTAVTPGDKFYWPGSCDTSHIAVFPCNLGLPKLAFAVWRMCLSQPKGRSIFRLVTCLDGPASLTPVAYIDTANMPAGTAVWNTADDVTAALNAFFGANCNTDCNVGWQVAGDGGNPYTVFSCRLELTWEIG